MKLINLNYKITSINMYLLMTILTMFIKYAEKKSIKK